MIDADYLTKVEARISSIETELSDPAAAANQARYRELLTEHAHLRKLHTTCKEYVGLVRDFAEHTAMINDPATDPELAEMAQAELADVETRLPIAEKKLKIALLPPDPDDARNIIMEIRAGTGGDEASLFAGDLFRMYSRYAEDHGWKINVIDNNLTPLGGFKEIIFSVEGDHVYRVMQYESGGHRVQRVPTTETQGRIHTSAATVAVLPEADEVDEIEIRSEDLRVDTYRASGAGGQHVNKTDSAVRITHLPTGLVVQSQEERSQHRNRDRVMRVLRAKLLDLQRQEMTDKEADARRTQIGSGDRSQRIRTYNFPQNRVTDHRINLTLYHLDRMIEGDLDELLSALYQQDMDLRLKTELEAQAGKGK